MARPDDAARPSEAETRPSEAELDELRRRAGSRDVDADVTVLRGEASEQRVPSNRARAEGAPPFAVWDRPASDAPADAEGATYFERPMLKPPTWIWTVPAYFFAGGIAGGSAVLAAAAQVADRDGLDGLIRRARWVGATAAAAGSGLLIADLGRPERFFNMLRVFRPSSPMNVGSWALSGAASLAMGAAVLDAPGTPLRPLGDALGLGAGVTALPVSTYTAVLLSNTAVPVWQEVRRSLPALFAASAVASASSVLDLFGGTERESRILRAYGVAGRVAELVAARAVEREARRVPRVGRPLERGVSGAAWRASEALTVASLGLSLLPTKRRAARVAAAVTGIASGVAVRFAVMRAGATSSQDPRASFELQRASASPPG